MAISNGHAPRLEGVEYTTFEAVAAATATKGNSIPPLTKTVIVTGVTNDANDWVTLPPLNSCPNGHEIVMIAEAGANFELRTPTSSNEEINSEDCDGTKEALCVDHNITRIIKINNTIGWMCHSLTPIGAVVTAVVPD